MKTEGELQKKSVGWARMGLYVTVLGIGLVSISTPWVSERIFDKWFSFPNILYLSFIPLLTGIGVLFLERFLKTLPRKNDAYAWVPFVSTVIIYVLCFSGLAFSFYPYIVPEKLKIVEAASAPESLKIILVGALVVLPGLVGYTFLAYKIFHGKAKELTYGE